MSHMCPCLLGPTMAFVCVCWLRRYLSFLSQSVRVLCWLWNQELGAVFHVPLLRDGTENIQWKLVGTGRQVWKDQCEK